MHRRAALGALIGLSVALLGCGGDETGGSSTASTASTAPTGSTASTGSTAGSAAVSSVPDPVPAGSGGFCDQIAALRDFYDTVAPEDALTLDFLRQNRALLGSVTDLPPALAAEWQVNLHQQDETIRLMEEAGATDAFDAPSEVFDSLQAQGTFGQLISTTVSSTCGFTLTFGG